MNLLLDTHAFIWFLDGDRQLPDHLKNIIADTSNRCFLSIASIWEIAVKASLSKLQLNGDFDQIDDFIAENYIEILPITFEHLQSLLKLHFYQRDPFDRLIIAQALTEDLTIAAKDEIFHKYEAKIIWK